MRTPVTVTRGMLLYFILALILSNVAISVSGVLYTNHSNRKADKRWCTLFAAIDRPVPSTIKDPVQRQRSEQTVSYIHQLRVDHGCVKK